jgi:hypothetical protein
MRAMILPTPGAELRPQGTPMIFSHLKWWARRKRALAYPR